MAVPSQIRNPNLDESRLSSVHVFLAPSKTQKRKLRRISLNSLSSRPRPARRMPMILPDHSASLLPFEVALQAKAQAKGGGWTARRHFAHYADEDGLLTPERHLQVQHESRSNRASKNASCIGKFEFTHNALSSPRLCAPWACTPRQQRCTSSRLSSAPTCRRTAARSRRFCAPLPSRRASRTEPPRPRC